MNNILSKKYINSVILKIGYNIHSLYKILFIIYMIYSFIKFIIIILSFDIWYYITYYNFDSICLSLVIPSTILSWYRCKKQIEYMICNSNEYPKEVVVVISGSNFSMKEEYNTYCNYKITLYFRKNKKNSASNKNYGSKYTKCSYISYFDSDDVMSHHRIKTLIYIIKNIFKYDIILHMYSRNYTIVKENVIDYNNILNHFYLNSSYITYLYRKNMPAHKLQLWGCCHFLPIKYHISNGWITIKRSLFDKEKFNEDISIQRAEDSEYNARVISKGYKILILTLVLGYYSTQNECNILK